MRERKLAECKYIDSSQVAGEGGYIERMRKMQKAANDVGANITNEQFIVKLLNLFPESWDPITSMLYGETDLIRVIQTLTTYSEHIVNRSNQSGIGVPMMSNNTIKALEAMIQALHAQVNGLSKRRSSNSDKKCLNCKRTNHI